MGIEKNRITQLPELVTVQDTDVFHVNSSNVDYKTTASAIKDYANNAFTGKLIRYETNIPISALLASATSAIPLDNTRPLSTEGIEISSYSYTPISMSNKLRVGFTVNIVDAIFSNKHLTIAMFLNNATQAILAATEYFVGPNQMMIISAAIRIDVIPTSPVIFRLRAGNTNPIGTNMWVNSLAFQPIFDGNMRSGIEIMELP